MPPNSERCEEISRKLASIEVEIDDGYIVDARDSTGSHWTPAAASRSGHLRRLTHLIVMGAAAVPMSATLAFAHPASSAATRLELEQPQSALAALPPAYDEIAMVSANFPDPNQPAATPGLSTAVPPVPGGVGYHFPWGQCTWYVSTRRYIPWSGDAWSWYGSAKSMNYSVGSTPRVGAIMVSKEGYVGHVAYVESVDGSTFTISEMNFRGLGVVDHRTLRLDRVALYGFIY